MKCRGRNIKTEKWIYKENLQDLMSLDDIDLGTIGYYTGVLDVLGRELYEGDKIRFLEDNTHWICKEYDVEDDIVLSRKDGQLFRFLKSTLGEFLIEGNIFDNNGE